MAIKKELLDELLAGSTGKDPFGKDGLIDELKKALAERALNAEMDYHLANEAKDGRTNHRNGYSKKSVLTDTSKIAIDVPRDRAGSFAAQLHAKSSTPIGRQGPGQPRPRQ
jgi:putative transposase